MSDTMDHQTLWYKIRYTPLRDALRGRLTARLDLHRQLEEAALPAEVKHLLRRVVRATRLWRLEQLEVQQELIAHFSDGIASGVPADELIRSFGDAHEAAQLIRRAKRRNRPMPWHALRYASWSTAVLIVAYCGYAAYFFAGRPSPRINYVDMVNSTVLKTPVEDRGWTFYRRALIGMEFRQNENISVQELDSLMTKERRNDLAEFVLRHQREIAWIHQGAAKSEFGWVTGAIGSTNDADLWPDPSQATNAKAVDSLALGSLPPLSGLRYLAALLRADAIVAGEADDDKRLLQDIDSVIKLSHQVGQKGPLLPSLISMAISEMAIEEMERALLDHSRLIKKSDWLTLGRRVSAPKVAADLFSFNPERMFYDDMLQHAFTDNGSGDGRLTAEGVKFIGFDYPPNTSNRWWREMIQPVAGLVVPSRRKLKEQYTQTFDVAEANLKLAIRDADWRTAAPSWRSFPINLAVPSFYRSQGAAERLLGHRDGVVTGIALELYRQEHGVYPENLNALVPELLPEVPVDRITGEPIHYRIVAGRPLLYSVGADRKDDGGRYELSPQQAGYWDNNTENKTKGDWILYPTIIER